MLLFRYLEPLAHRPREGALLAKRTRCKRVRAARTRAGTKRWEGREVNYRETVQVPWGRRIGGSRNFHFYPGQPRPSVRIFGEASSSLRKCGRAGKTPAENDSVQVYLCGPQGKCTEVGLGPIGINSFQYSQHSDPFFTSYFSLWQYGHGVPLLCPLDG